MSKKKFQQNRSQVAAMKRQMQERQRQVDAVIAEQQAKADSMPDTFELSTLEKLLDWQAEIGMHVSHDPSSCPLAVKAFKVRAEIVRRVGSAEKSPTLLGRLVGRSA